MRTYRLEIEIEKNTTDSERHIIHETAVGYEEFVEKMDAILSKGLKVDLLPDSYVWYPAHKIEEIFVEIGKEESKE